MHDITIRQLVESDFDEWLSLWREYQNFYQVDFPAEVNAATWQRILCSDEPIYGLAAESNGKVIGFAHYVTRRSTWSLKNACYLHDLYVDRKSRGIGAATKLVQRTVTEARTGGASKLYWLTQEDNATARSIYEKLANRSNFTYYSLQL
jgi:GNAT superfamily N-acetyltransferase